MSPTVRLANSFVKTPPKTPPKGRNKSEFRGSQALRTEEDKRYPLTSAKSDERPYSKRVTQELSIERHRESNNFLYKSIPRADTAIQSALNEKQSAASRFTEGDEQQTNENKLANHVEEQEAEDGLEEATSKVQIEHLKRTIANLETQLKVLC